jgi:hypothetical protein
MRYRIMKVATTVAALIALAAAAGAPYTEGS